MLDVLWNKILASLEGNIPPSVLDSWVRSCHLAAIDQDHVRIEAPNKFTRDWLAQHHTESLEVAAAEALGGKPRVSFEVARVPTQVSPAPRAPREASPPSSPAGLSSRYTFDSFVVGNSNQFAQAACQAVADLPSKAYNPLFIYGGVGLGKTHLLHAVAHQITRLHPSLRLLYLSTERFTNELINAIRYDRTAEFRTKYRNIDLLLIDDIQFISGKERTQEEFFHTFNDLYEAHRQIVVSSDSPPKEIPDIEERLRSRFEWGLIADISTPDLETRIAILRAKAEAQSVSVPPPVIDFLAQRIVSNIRELEGALTRICAYATLNAVPVTTQLAQEILQNILYNPRQKTLSPDKIVEIVARYYGVPVGELKGKARDKQVVLPRQIAMYLMREETEAPLLRIGEALGGRDHSTVLHGCEKIEREMTENDDFRRDVGALREMLYAE